MTPVLPNGEAPKGQHPAKHPEAPAHSDTPRPSRAQESLGLGARSGLFKSSIQAGIGFAVIFAGLTVGPYFWEKSHAGTKDTNSPAEKGDKPAAGSPVAPAPTDPNAAAKQPAPGTTASGKQPGKGDIVDKLGENSTKTAPTKVNPLDKKDDDILRDIKP